MLNSKQGVGSSLRSPSHSHIPQHLAPLHPFSSSPVSRQASIPCPKHSSRACKRSYARVDTSAGPSTTANSPSDNPNNPQGQTILQRLLAQPLVANLVQRIPQVGELNFANCVLLVICLMCYMSHVQIVRSILFRLGGSSRALHTVSARIQAGVVDTFNKREGHPSQPLPHNTLSAHGH
jgi:hypothetical protein